MPPQVQSENSRTQSEWNISTIQDQIGGLNRALPAHLIDESQSPDMENLVVRNGILQVDSGWSKLGINEFSSAHRTLYGLPRKFWVHETNAGLQTLLCFTDESVWRLGAGGDWELVPTGTSSTLASATTGGEGSVTVASDASFSVGGVIDIINDAGDHDFRKITAKPGGNVLTLDAVLPTPFVASIGNAVTAGTILSGGATNQFVVVAVPSQQWTVFTNGVDNPRRYDGSTIAALPNVSAQIGVTRCTTMAVFANALILMNLTQSGVEKPGSIVWSDTGDPSTWNSGTAGSEDLFDNRDSIVASELLADSLYIFRSRSIVRCEFRGTTLHHFFFRTMIPGTSVGSMGVGALSPNSVVGGSDRLYVMSKDGIYFYQGGFSITPISAPVFPGIFDAQGELDKELAGRSFMHFVDEYDELFAFYPTTGVTDHPKKALIYSLKTGTWAPRLFSQEISGIGAVFESSSPTYNDLVGTMIEQTWTAASKTVDGKAATMALGVQHSSGVGKVFNYDFISGSEDGTAIPWYYETKDFMFHDREHWFNRFDVYMAGSGVSVLYSRDGGAGTVSLGSYSPGAMRDRVRISRDVRAKMLRLRFTGSGGGFELGFISTRDREASRWSL